MIETLSIQQRLKFWKKGIVTELFKKIGNLDQNDKKEYASKLNSLKQK